MEQALCARMGIPWNPTKDSTEKFRSLMATRNEWQLYKRKCDHTGQEIISAYPADAPFPVYSNAVWWGDAWDALDYGKPFDFDRLFFEQFAELQKAVPREGTSIVNSENCDYNSHIRESRNCYLNSLMVKCEDVMYSYWMVGTKNTLDSLHTHQSTLCYWCHDVTNGYNCIMLEASKDCNDCYFSFELRGCHNCIFSNNLNNKNYYAFNKLCTPEEFEKLKNTYINGSWKSWQEGYKMFMEIRKKALHRHARLINCENCTGDHLFDCRNCFTCFDSDNSEDCVNAISASQGKDIINSYSAGWTGCEMVYNSCVTRGSIDIAYCTYTWWSNNLRYCDSCSSSKNCFGCIGLKHKEYCILNKQYSKKEYEALLPRVIAHMEQTGEWGQFFPKTLYVFAYNESAANDYYPLSKEEALAKGYKWREVDQREYQAASLKELPDQIADVPDDFNKEILACSQCGKNYRIILNELAFYKRMELPLPRECPSCRHKDRYALRNPCILNDITCKTCGKNVRSTYPANSAEEVLCNECYLSKID
ncbi:MAG: hypothetical protein WC924_03800 [Candidatus Gracilibacteria bacterium]